MTRTLNIGLAAVLAIGLVGPVFAAQSILINASLENGAGALALDPMVPASWTREGNVVERSAEANLVPAGAGHALKAVQSSAQEIAFQEIPVAAGNSVSISAQLYTRGIDKLGGDAFAGIAMSFYNISNAEVGSTQAAFPLVAASPADTWIPAAVGPVIAPAGAVKVRMTCAWVSSTGSGSAFWDDCQLKINGGANLIVNGDFEQAGQGDQSPTGIDDWGGFNDQEKSGAFAFHGSSSVKVGTSEPYSGLYQTRTGYVVEDGDLLVLRGRVWQSSSNPLTANARAGLKLEFASTGSGTLPPPTENLALDENATTDAWQQVSIGPLTVPDGASGARLTLIFVPNASAPNGHVYFDSAWVDVGGGNLLLNSSFEDGAVIPDLWSIFQTGGGCDTPAESCAVKSAVEISAYDGDSTAKAGGDAYAGFYQEVSVTPGQTLNAHAQAFVRGIDPLEGTSLAGIKVEWSGGSLPPNVDITPDASANTITASSPTDTWIPLEIEFTMPAGTQAYPRFVNLVAAGAGTGEVYFDACELVVLNNFNGADADGDDDEDLHDFAELQRCFNGDGAGELGFNCLVFDNDDDLDVDLTDFEYFQPRLTGP